MDRVCVPIPGAFNALVGLAARDAGFEALYVSGGATSAAAGVPDVGLLGLEHFTRLIRELADAAGLPILADADTGFGEAEMTRRVVVEYARAGAAGLHIEDQVFPKRCGHLDGKRLVEIDHFCEKIAWASGAAAEIGDGQLVVCARTDAAGVEGIEAAIDRARAYTEAGASMIFPEGLRSEEEFARFAEAMRTIPGPDPRGGPYLLANMTEFGKTPVLPLSSFERMGYSCVIYPVSMLRVAMGAVSAALTALHREGTVAGFMDRMQTRQELYGLLGYTPGEPWTFPGRGDPQ